MLRRSPEFVSFVVAVLSSLLLSLYSLADAEADALPKLKLDFPARTADEIARDVNRKPAETLAFFGIRDDMTVVELFPGSGWYTKVLGAYLAKKGKLYVALGTERVADKLEGFGLSGVEVIGKTEGFEKTDQPGFIFSVTAVDLGVRDVDMVLTFRNAHNFTSDARAKLNRAAFDALKPGGVYGIIDHTQRHMAPFTAEAWRRVDPVQIIKEALAAGFEFVDYSTLHARPEDNLKHDTRHESLVNESDRFTLKFRKPLDWEPQAEPVADETPDPAEQKNADVVSAEN